MDTDSFSFLVILFYLWLVRIPGVFGSYALDVYLVFVLKARVGQFPKGWL
jgi:hypothetical protein